MSPWFLALITQYKSTSLKQTIGSFIQILSNYAEINSKRYSQSDRMPKNQIQKSLQDYLSKMKKPPTTPSSQNQIPPTPRSLSSSTSWILRGCKHPRTPSFSSCDKGYHKGAVQESTSPDRGAATLSDVDRFLLENFKTLYQNDDDDDDEEEEEEDAAEIKRSIEDENEENPIEIFPGSARSSTTHPPGRNRRFFVAPAAASSCSLIEEAARRSLTSSSDQGIINSSSTIAISASTANDLDDDDDEDAERELSPDDFITVLTYSLNPYDDFKKSMQEMIDARHRDGGEINWEFMEELLFCYLNLNDKKSHGFILSAFVDLVVVLRENAGCVPAKPRSVPSKVGRRCRIN